MIKAVKDECNRNPIKVISHIPSNYFNSSSIQQSEDLGRLEQAIHQYGLAKIAWQGICKSTNGVYSENITFGYQPFMRGHWKDRLLAIEEDLAAMEEIYQKVSSLPSVGSSVECFTASRKESPSCTHIQTNGFVKGEPIELRISLLEARSDLEFTLYYRHVNQVEGYCSTEMKKVENDYTATIPVQYTDSSYSILYYFEVKSNTQNDAWLFPGFEEDLSNQEYFLLRQEK